MIENFKNSLLNDDSQRTKKIVNKDDSWLKDKNHPVLKKLEEKGGIIFLMSDGKIAYRLSSNEQYKSTKDFKGLEIVLSNFLGIDVDLSAFIKSKSKNEKLVDEFENEFKIKPDDLIMVSDTTFNPNNKEEFIQQENGTYLRNKFTLSKYLQMNGDEIDNVKFKFEKSKTFYFLLHLLNHDYKRVQWVINWLAYFFQGLKKSQVALVLVGIEGTGKGVLVEDIIKPLFGALFVKSINDKSLNTKYLGGLVEDVIFFYFDEISSQRSLTDSIRNFLKAIITNLSITAEKKHKTLEKETPLYGQVIFSTNEYDALEISKNDRRYTAFLTGDTLASVNFLSLGSYDALAEALTLELEMFACYLKTYSVDVQMANTALSTPEKNEMIYQYAMKQEVKAVKQQKVLQPKLTKLQRNLDELAYYIRNKEIGFFESIRFENNELFQIICRDLENNVFRVDNLLPVYKALYGSTSIKTNSELLRELQNIDFDLFSIRNISLWIINDIQINCLNLPHNTRYY